MTEKTGRVIGAEITNDINQDLIIVSKFGQVIRIPLKSAKVLGRDTQGVRLMKIASSDKIASVSPVATKVEEEIAEIASKPEEVRDKDEKIVAKGNVVKEKSKNNDGLEIHYWKENGK